MAFDNYNDNDSDGQNVNITDPTDPTKKMAVESIDGKNRALVDANLSSGQLVPTITNNLRVRLNTTTVSLPASGVYQTLFTRSGEGLFFGFQTSFNNSGVNVRLTIDSGVVFDTSLDDIREFKFNDTSTTRCQSGAFFTTIGNVLDFSSRFAIPYTSSITLEAASNDSVAHNNNNWLVILTED